MGISVGPTQSGIKNIGTASVSSLSSGKQGSFFEFMEIGYFFSNNIGLSSGLGYISDKSQLTLKNYQNTEYIIKDDEQETYNQSVSGSDIKELQNVSFLSVPLHINLRLPFNKTTGFFLQTGINLNVPLNKTYTSSGTFTYKGYYYDYNVWLTDLPTHGFSTNKKVTDDGKLQLKHLDLAFSASAGIDFFFQEKVQMAAAIFFDKSLSDISNYSEIEKFQLSTSDNQIRSLMGGSNKATVQSIGLMLSVRYYLK